MSTGSDQLAAACSARSAALGGLDAGLPRGLSGQHHRASAARLHADTVQGVVDVPAMVAALQKHLPADAVLTNGAGNFAGWLHRYFRYSGLARRQKHNWRRPTIMPWATACLLGLRPASLTGRTVLTFTGDGDF